MEETLTGAVQYIQLTCDSRYHHICIITAQWNSIYHNWTFDTALYSGSLYSKFNHTYPASDLQAAHLSTISLYSIQSWLNKLNPSHWFHFGLIGLIGIGGLMLLGLLSIIWLKRLIMWENNHHKKEKSLNAFFIKKKKRQGDMDNSQDPQSLLEEWSHCSFCATALREIATVQEDSCWIPLFSLCMRPGRPSSKNMMFRTWARSHSNVTANPSSEVKGNLGTARYSFLLFCTA
jgi:hypothetical protein